MGCGKGERGLQGVLALKPTRSDATWTKPCCPGPLDGQQALPLLSGHPGSLVFAFEEGPSGLAFCCKTRVWQGLQERVPRMLSSSSPEGLSPPGARPCSRRAPNSRPRRCPGPRSASPRRTSVCCWRCCRRRRRVWSFQPALPAFAKTTNLAGRPRYARARTHVLEHTYTRTRTYGSPLCRRAALNRDCSPPLPYTPRHVSLKSSNPHPTAPPPSQYAASGSNGTAAAAATAGALVPHATANVATPTAAAAGGVKRFVRQQVPDDILHNDQLNEAIRVLPANYNFEIHKTVRQLGGWRGWVSDGQLAVCGVRTGCVVGVGRRH